MTNATRIEKAMTAVSLALAIAFGIIFSASPAFACDGTNAGAGNCKQAAPSPAPTAPERWLVVESVIRGLQLIVRF